MPIRVQGSYISDKDITVLVDCWKKQANNDDQSFILNNTLNDNTDDYDDPLYDEVVDFPYTNIFNLFIKPYLDYIEKSVEFSIRNFPRINNELYDLDDRVASIGYSDVSFSKDKPLTIGKILKKYLKKSSQA